VKRLLLGLLGLAAVACARAHRDNGVPAGIGPLVVVYKVAIDDGSGAVRGARLSVWAEAPDRLHAELIAPIGGVKFILDAGGGNACIVDVAAATAYVGADGPGAIEALVGVRVSVADAVAALLHGASPDGLAVTRIGGADGDLPHSIRIADGARSIVLARVRVERGKTDPRSLGTGIPPKQLPLRPIESLAREVAGEPAPAGGDR
jgi:hypothetical protein